MKNSIENPDPNKKAVAHEATMNMDGAADFAVVNKPKAVPHEVTMKMDGAGNLTAESK